MAWTFESEREIEDGLRVHHRPRDCSQDLDTGVGRFPQRFAVGFNGERRICDQFEDR